MNRIAAAAGQGVDVVQSNYTEEILGEGNGDIIDERAIASGDDSGQENHEYFAGEDYQKEEENELRRTVQAVFELEEALLNQHMSNIQVENFETCLSFSNDFRAKQDFQGQR